jgi:hypothetical protein
MMPPACLVNDIEGNLLPGTTPAEGYLQLLITHFYDNYNTPDLNNCIPVCSDAFDPLMSDCAHDN